MYSTADKAKPVPEGSRLSAARHRVIVSWTDEFLRQEHGDAYTFTRYFFT